MKLYENKMEISLNKALTVLFTNNVPGTNIHYMISFDDVDRKIKFGKGYNPFYRDTTWTIVKNDIIISFAKDNVDEFLMELFDDPYMVCHFGEKKFHVWEEIRS